MGFSCSGLFKCVRSKFQVCVHPTDICNGINDCDSGKDEYLCELPRQCPGSCQCLMYAVSCRNKHLEDILEILRAPLLYIHLVYVIFFSKNEIHISYNVLALKWGHSNLTDICHSLRITLIHLQILEYSNNNILELTDNCFHKISNLQVLILKHN